MNAANNKESIASEFLQRIEDERRKARIMQRAPQLVLVGMLIIFSIIAEGFFSITNFVNLLNQMTILLIVAVGLTFIIVLGSINLAVEGMMAMSGSIFAVLVLNNSNNNDLGLIAVVIVLVIGAFTGLLMGLIHVKLKLPSFMVTFAFSFIGVGVALLSYGGFPPTIMDPLFTQISLTRLLRIPLITWIAGAVFAFGLFLERKTAFGSHVYAAGSNEQALKSVGVDVEKVRVLVFIFCGVCFALAGMIAAIRLGRGEARLGQGTLFPALTAVVVGGTPMSGGKGGMLNTLTGVLIITVLKNAMVLLGINPYIQDAVEGVLIAVAVALSVAKGRNVITK